MTFKIGSATRSRISRAVRSFQILGAPVLITEQYPKGLGHTSKVILEAFEMGSQPIEKTMFSSCGSDAFVTRLRELNVRQIALCGVEAHICVNQTAHELIELGYQVHLLCDAVSSRHDYNRLAGIAKMTRAGAIESSVEMALFEMMRDSRHEKFKEIQALVK
ncbi:MAG TPA: isochorismatase family protein [Pyrinomonadaceae bacterium]|nr:isochorismatase family protein [Pyrinomonadaceae bacterium]